MATLFGRAWSRADLQQHVGQVEQLAGIKALEAADGTERGVRLYEVWTGTGLSFQVLADRALDISTAAYKGMSLAWRSSVGDVHPAYYEPEGLRWLRSFPGGLLATCGLDYFGAPSDDQGEAFGIHGRVGNTPAKAVAYRAYWDEDEYRLEISGQVRQTRVYGENLVLHRRIRTALGSNAIEIEDTVTNEAFVPQPHMMLYHFNLGFPLLSAESRLRVKAVATQPRDETAAAGLDRWDVFQAPTAGYREQVFRHTVAAESDGMAQVELHNPTLSLGLRFTYDAAVLPYLYQWKQMGQGIYVLGIEPGNSGSMDGRAAARAANALPILEPGASVTYRLGLEVVEGD